MALVGPPGRAGRRTSESEAVRKHPEKDRGAAAAERVANQEKQRIERSEVIQCGEVSAAKLAGGENQTRPGQPAELRNEPHLLRNCAHGDPSLTPEGGWHMVLRKDKVEIGNSG